MSAPGFLAALRAATRQSGTLLVVDATQTLSSGCGGHARSLEWHVSRIGARTSNTPCTSSC